MEAFRERAGCEASCENDEYIYRLHYDSSSSDPDSTDSSSSSSSSSSSGNTVTIVSFAENEASVFFVEKLV
jgi:hypothetical protein